MEPVEVTFDETNGSAVIYESSVAHRNYDSIAPTLSSSVHRRQDDDLQEVSTEDLSEFDEEKAVARPIRKVMSEDESVFTNFQENYILPQPDIHGHIAHYPGEKDQRRISCRRFILEDSVLPSTRTAAAVALPTSSRTLGLPNKGDDTEVEEVPGANESDSAATSRSCLDQVMFFYSITLLLFCIVVVMTAIFTKQTKITGDMGVHSFIAFIVFWLLICWLAMMEGGQGALVGLQPIKKERYIKTHPHALMCTKLAHTGNNMERFIIGRQFLVVLVLFVVNLMASSIDGASVLGFPSIMNEIFLASGIALIMVTVTVGQLTAQVNAASCMLDFINNYFMLFTTYLSLAIEKSGLLHSVYLVQVLFSSCTGTPVQSDEPPRNAMSKFFFWLRVLVSLGLLGFSFAVTLEALFSGQTSMWEGIPYYVSVIVFFVLMCFVGMMEGMQIALFAVVNFSEEELQQHPTANKSCKLTFSGQNLQAFLIGRQICVTVCTFIIARITTVNIDYKNGEETIFGVPDFVQEFINTGLLGALITTVVASLAWRVIASSYPMAFLSNPLVYLIVRLCLMLEKSGICSAAWVLAHFHKKLVNYRPDKYYLEDENGRRRKSKQKSIIKQ